MIQDKTQMQTKKNIYMYIYTYIDTYIYIYTYIDTYIYIYINENVNKCMKVNLYLKYVYMAEFSHIYPHIQYICTQEVHTTLLQCIHTQEAGVYYTRLIQLWCSTTQLLCGGLQHQPSYTATW